MARPIALISDIHGNRVALDAVLADCASAGVAEYWVLGDLVALGPDPVGVLERLTALPNARFIRGNTDRYVVTGDRPPPYAHDVGADPALLRVYAEVAGTFAWTQGALTAGGWLDWLAGLPLELRETLPDGTDFLGVHAAPGTDDGDGIQPDAPNDALRALLAGCGADLICVGHTHLALDRALERWRVVNPGSVSNPRGHDLRASYVLLDADADGYRCAHRRVDYDRAQVVARLRAQRHPGAEFIIRHMRGEM